MSYPYSQINRLDEPHSYMYSQFQGVSLLQSYQSSRMEAIKEYAMAEDGDADFDLNLVSFAFPVIEKCISASAPNAGIRFRELLSSLADFKLNPENMAEGDLGSLGKMLERLIPEKRIETLDLLQGVIADLLINANSVESKLWLDRLVQRFEVTKKIFEYYQPGLRKGEGSSSVIRLYWLLSLALALYYVETGEIKYMSTLLKVCDLLCSLPINMVQGNVPKHGLVVVLATELISVQHLAEGRGISIATR